jgi:antitoxin (DNA-binding transcriptional repressor) of toxin-antitoxin stability system
MDMSVAEITQRDLRFRSREILDAVERGQAFIVTRDGHRIGELVPIRRRKFVSQQEFAAMSRNAPASDLDAFRADQDAVAEHEESGPVGRLRLFPQGRARAWRRRPDEVSAQAAGAL